MEDIPDDTFLITNILYYHLGLQLGIKRIGWFWFLVIYLIGFEKYYYPSIINYIKALG